MELLNRIKGIKEEQKKLQESFEKLSREVESSPIYNENEKLKSDLAELKERYEKLSLKNMKIVGENENLRITLQEQITDEKLNILKVSKEKLMTYFNKEADSHYDRLSAFEMKIKRIIEDLENLSRSKLKGEEQQFLAEANELHARVNERLKTLKEEHQKREQEQLKSMQAGLSSFSEEGLDEETIQKRIKQSKFEMKIGLHLLNKIGVVLIVIGVGLFAYLNRTNVADWVKSAIFYLAGIGFLIGGEFVYRKKMKPLAMALIGGGFAVLYAATFFSFFLLKTIGMEAALGISVLITVTSLVLSLRYDSKVVISLALVGGFIPFTSYAMDPGFSGNTYYLAMGYLLMLNLLVLGVSFFKKWNISNYLSFLLNVPALSYLVFTCDNETAALIYASITFAMYLAIIMAYPLINKEPLKAADMVLLALNTLISSAFIFTLFEIAGYGEYRAILPIIFSIVYGGLGLFTSKVMKTEKISIVLFYLTGLAFAVLAIPLILEPEFVSMGWLVEGTLLVIYGYKNRSKLLERSGWVVYLLCLTTFLFFDLTYNLLTSLYGGSQFSQLFNLKFLFVTASMVAITTIYQLDIKKGTLSEFSLKGTSVKVFKFVSMLVTYIFSCYTILYYFNDWIKLKGNYNLFFSLNIMTLITFGFVLGLPYLTLYYDKTIKVAVTIFKVLFGIIFYGTLLFVAPVGDYYDNLALLIPAIALLITVNFLFLFMLRLSIINFIRRKEGYIEFYPVAMGIVFLINLTLFYLIQFELGRYPIVLSLLYFVTAIGFISYGFVRKYIYIRYMGLIVVGLSLAKLFIVDLWDIGGTQKVVAYLSFGALLIALSVVYQLINKRLSPESNIKITKEDKPKENIDEKDDNNENIEE